MSEADLHIGCWDRSSSCDAGPSWGLMYTLADWREEQREFAEAAAEHCRSVMARRGRWLVVFSGDRTAVRMRSLSEARRIQRFHRADGVEVKIRRYRRVDAWWSTHERSLVIR